MKKYIKIFVSAVLFAHASLSMENPEEAVSSEELSIYQRIADDHKTSLVFGIFSTITRDTQYFCRPETHGDFFSDIFKGGLSWLLHSKEAGLAAYEESRDARTLNQKNAQRAEEIMKAASDCETLEASYKAFIEANEEGASNTLQTNVLFLREALLIDAQKGSDTFRTNFMLKTLGCHSQESQISGQELDSSEPNIIAQSFQDRLPYIFMSIVGKNADLLQLYFDHGADKMADVNPVRAKMMIESAVMLHWSYGVRLMIDRWQLSPSRRILNVDDLYRRTLERGSDDMRALLGPLVWGPKRNYYWLRNLSKDDIMGTAAIITLGGAIFYFKANQFYRRHFPTTEE